MVCQSGPRRNFSRLRGRALCSIRPTEHARSGQRLANCLCALGITDARDAGADIIHGHGARLFQGVEIYEDRMILYDTGSIIDDFETSPTLRNDLCFFVRAQVDRKGLRRVEFVPVYKSKQQVNRAQGDAFRMGVRNLLKRSEPFQPQFLAEPDQLVLAPDAFGRWDI